MTGHYARPEADEDGSVFWRCSCGRETAFTKVMMFHLIDEGRAEHGDRNVEEDDSSETGKRSREARSQPAWNGKAGHGSGAKDVSAVKRSEATYQRIVEEADDYEDACEREAGGYDRIAVSGSEEDLDAEDDGSAEEAG